MEDVNYADDLALPSEELEDVQEKIIRLSRKTKSVGLKINTKKTEILRKNCWDQNPIE